QAEVRPERHRLPARGTERGREGRRPVTLIIAGDVEMMPANIATRVPTGPPRNMLWTVDQFHYLGDLGMFEGRRAMLIDGVIVEEGPMNPPHAIAATKTEDLIRDAFGKGWHVRVAKPLVLGQATDPEPDVTVVAGKPGDYTSHPTAAA